MPITAACAQQFARRDLPAGRMQGSIEGIFTWRDSCRFLNLSPSAGIFSIDEFQHSVSAKHLFSSVGVLMKRHGLYFCIAITNLHINGDKLISFTHLHTGLL